MASQRPPAAIAGIAAKIEWAVEHHKELSREVVAWLKGNPCETVSEFDPDTNVVLVRLASPNPPLRFGVKAGNVIHQLRSSLDHLVWELVRAYGQQEPKAGPGGNQFPIFSDPAPFADPDAFAKKTKGMLQGVRPNHRAFIEDLQPYKRPNPSRSSLDVLARLSNADKHQTLVPTTGLIDPNYGHRAELVAVRDVGAILEVMLAADPRLAHGAVIARAKIVPTGPHPEVRMDLQASRYVALEDTQPMMTLLDTVGRMVGGIIDAFEPVFGDIEAPPKHIEIIQVAMRPKFTGIPLPFV